MNWQDERWAVVKEAEGYSVSDRGRVVSFRSGWPRYLKQGRNSKGYPTVSIRLPDRWKTERVHRLVAKAFHGPPRGREVNHIDADRENNRASNLEWVTRKQNHDHARRMGLYVRPDAPGTIGPTAKLRNEQVLEIRRRIADGEDCTSTSRRFDVSDITIRHIRDGVHYGMVQEAAD